MKDSKTIISHLKSNPNMKILKQKECEARLLSLMPNMLSKSVKFIYTKNDTLFFVLNHAAAKMEFDYKRNLIKGLLKQLISFYPECSLLHAQHLKAFVTNKPQALNNKTQNSMIFYAERSNGDFINASKKPKLFELFESIRGEIIKNND